MSVETMVLFGHVDLADSGIMINEDDSLGFGVGDCSTIMRHGFIGRVGVWLLLRPQMTLHTSGLPAFETELCKRSFQLLALASLIAIFASQHALIHSYWF